MRKINCCVFFVFLLVLLSFNFVLAQEVSLSVSLDQNVYYSSDPVNFDIEIKNSEAVQINIFLDLEIKKIEGGANIENIEKQVIILPNRTHSEKLTFSLETGKYIATTFIKSSDGIILQKDEINFEVYSKTNLIDIKICKDSNCNEISSIFLPNEEIFLNINKLENNQVSGKCITPEGDSFDVIFQNNKARIVSDRIGEHTVTIIIKNGEEISEKTFYFTIQEGITENVGDNISLSYKDYNSWYILLVIIIILIIGAFYILYRIKKNKL